MINIEEFAKRKEGTFMKNTLNDLKNYLFESIERLTDDSLSAEELYREIQRSNAVQNVARTIIDNGKLVFHAKKHLDEYGRGDSMDVSLLGVNNNGE